MHKDEGANRFGSNVTGCTFVQKREVNQAVKTVEALARCVNLDEPERLQAQQLASLLRPLGRSLRDGEALVTVEPTSVPWSLPVTVEKPDLLFVPSTNLSDGTPLIDTDHSYRVIPNALVTDQGYVCADNIFLIDSVQFTLPNWAVGKGHPWFYRAPPIASFNPDDRTAFVELKEGRVEDVGFLFSVQNASINFGHFIHDFLIQLPLFFSLRHQFPSIKCLLHKQFKFLIQREIVSDLLGLEISDGRFISPDVSGVYRRLIVPTLQFGYVTPSINIVASQQVRMMLRDFAATRGERSAGRYHKVFVSRRDGTSNEYRRDEINHQKLEDMFRRRGYHVVSVSDLDVPTMLGLFYGAEVVAGVHGAGLMNVFFSGADAPSLIELDTIRPGWKSIERFTRASGISYKVFSPELEGDSYGYSKIEDLI